MRSPALTLILVVWCTSAAGAQDAPPHTQHVAGSDTVGAYMDAGAAALLARARAARSRTDHSLTSYTAVVRSRVSAALRTPLKDRTLLRHEAAARVRWSRDGDNIVHVLAARTQTPGGVSALDGVTFPLDNLFDPSRDRLYFGSMPVRDERPANEDFWIEHPLGASAERHYRYQSGDTLTVTLQGGQVVRIIELRVMPRRDDPQTVRGTLWIDTQTGALVQSAFRLARVVDILRDLDVDDDDVATAARIPLINPMEFDISLMTVEYGLWEMEHWLPRSMRFEGMVRLGTFRLPAAADVSYRMLAVDIASSDTVHVDGSEAERVNRTLEEWSAGDDVSTRRMTSNSRGYHVIRPIDDGRLLEHELLPPPIWVDAPGFTTEAELRELYDRLSRIAGPQQRATPIRLGWAPGEPDMMRYNRVEALSLGARVTAQLPLATVSAVARIGAVDLHPNAELSVRRESVRRTLELRLYHELTTADEARRALGIGNSLSALLLGRDEGEYYRATGAALTFTPPSTRRPWWEGRAYAERHTAVERGTHIALPRIWTDSVFRPNIAADEASQYGLLLLARPWWGSDPLRAQFGIEGLLQAETGDFEHLRGRITLRGAAPLGGRLRVGAELGAGTSEGSVPVQRMFFLGGASTLRGYEPATVSGTSMARGRLELARAYPFGNLAIFSDWGWAGDRSDIDRHRQRWSLGAGASLLDGLVRLDLARGLREPRGWRIDLHVDALM